MSSLRFGPEWMRKPSRTHLQPSPEPIATHNGSANPSSASSYSALVSPANAAHPPKRDETYSFRYTKEELIRIYKEGGGKGGLPLEVDRWEGVTHEIGSEPVSMREMTEEEKKHFAGPLNSELRRRQSNDYLSPLSTQNLGAERPRLNHGSSGAGSPMRERFGGLGIKRRDSTDTNPATMPRKLSFSSMQGPAGSPNLPSPRTTRPGYSPGFDGVLSGDSWLARKRASDAKAGGTPQRGPPGEEGDKKFDIPEEDEGQSQPSFLGTEIPSDEPQPLSMDPTKPDALHGPNQSLESSLSNMSVNHYNQGQGGPMNSVPPIGPPPGLAIDLAGVEWSYLDPQGQIQGPFRADIMQKWFDDGYFAAELLMRRTHLDSEWITVADLSRRSGNDRPFLTPLGFGTPPGLGAHHDSPLPGFSVPNPTPYNIPYQPSPARPYRATTLDDYLGTNSIPPSPSNFSGRPQDSPLYNNRGAIGDSAVGSRLLGLQGRVEPNFASPGSRVPLNDLNRGYPGRVSSLDSHGYNNTYNASPSPWSSATSSYEPRSNNGSAHSSPFLGHVSQVPMYDSQLEGRGINPATIADMNGIGPSSQSPYSGHNGLTGQPYNNNHSAIVAEEAPVIPTTEPTPVAEPPTHQLLGDTANDAVVIDSSWPSAATASINRPSIADTPASTSDTTAVPVAPKAWNTVPKPSEASPWYVGSTITSDDQWQEVQDGDTPSPVQAIDNSTPVKKESRKKADVPIVATGMDSSVATTVETVSQISPTTTESPVAPSKQSRKTSITSTPKLPPPTSQVTVTPVVTPTIPSKAPWSTDEDKKPASVTMTLREIQEAEAKKAEAKKQAEREKERLARAASAASPSNEDSAPFTTSWGLPTSQTGARSNTKENTTIVTSTNSTPAASTPPAVWTTSKPQSTTKKTMKEIQEEEERRKKVAAKETVAQAAARRAYAESTAKPTSTPLSTGAWTTVGPSGKTVAVAPPRPPIPASVSSVTAVPKVNGSPIVRSAAPATSKPAPVPVKAAIEDFPAPPSHDFLKWLGDALKGLNSSVNVEEIISMLLTFPLDPDPSTLELISDLIYANSTTLDGRRFSSDFVNKRRTDAARPKTANSSAAKIASIADVVKAQPKPTQPEWGGFKVVNKKKKGSRT